MDLHCMSKECTATPFMFCNCVKEFTMMCLEHVQEHILQDESKDHNLRPIYKKVDESKRTAIEVKVQEILQKIKLLKHSFTHEHAKAVESLEKIRTVFLSNFKKAKVCYRQILSKASSYDKIFAMPCKNSDPYVDADLENISKLIEDAHQIFPDKKIIDHELIFFEGFIKNLFVTEHEKEQPSPFSENIYFFKAESHVLAELHVEDLELKENEVGVKENLGLLASICLIPGDKLFYHGGYNGDGDAIATTYIINLKTRFAEALPKGRLRCTASAIYYLGSIYIFGGYGKNAIKQCDKFSVKRKTWEEISDLPCPVQNTSTIQVKGSFIITGLGSKIYKYEIETNKYSVVISGMNIGGFNILIKESPNIYLLSAGIYLSSEDTLDKWLFTEKINDIISSTTCRPVLKDRFAYFLCQDGEIMKFNLDTLELMKIRQIYD